VQRLPYTIVIDAREIEEMRKTPVTTDELQRAKTMRLRQISLAEASTGAIRSGLDRPLGA
jgi:hypothetical protein